ncbi:MAG: EF-hand domain-containing protein [Cyclobacteriaceae bacterium]
MLTPLLKEKLTHYFNLLDYDNNGTIEKEDFTAIAENLCVLWRFKEGTEKYNHYMYVFGQSWIDFRNLVDHSDPDHATLDEWLDFADKHIVNGSEEFFDKYIGMQMREIFDCFDANGDGYISLDEYIDLFMAYRIEVRYSAKSYIRLDLNQDDLLSRDELFSAINEFFCSDDPLAPGNWLYGFWSEERTV